MYNVQYAAQRGAHTVHCQTMHVSTNTSTNTVGGAGTPLEGLQPFQRYNPPHLPWSKGQTPYTNHWVTQLSVDWPQRGRLPFLWGWAGWLEDTANNQPLPLSYTLLRITLILSIISNLHD